MHAALGGKAGFHPSMIPLPCSSPHLCCSFLWVITAKHQAENLTRELQVKVRTTWWFRQNTKTLQCNPQEFSEAVLSVFKRDVNTCFESNLPPVMWVGDTEVLLYISTRTCRHCNLCLVKFCGWGFLAWVGAMFCRKSWVIFRVPLSSVLILLYEGIVLFCTGSNRNKWTVELELLYLQLLWILLICSFFRWNTYLIKMQPVRQKQIVSDQYNTADFPPPPPSAFS